MDFIVNPIGYFVNPGIVLVLIVGLKQAIKKRPGGADFIDPLAKSSGAAKK